MVDGAVNPSEVMACRALFDVDPDEIGGADLVFYGQLVSRLVQTRVRMWKSKQARDAQAPPVPPGTGKDDAAAAAEAS